MINLFQPTLAHAELAAVARVFDSSWLGRGSIATEFETAWAQHIGVEPEQCLSITSATEGLFTVFQMILSPGDEVIIPSIHFHGVANAVRAAGGKPVFCDVDKRTLNITPETLAPRITPKTKAVCVLHYGGYPCEIDTLALMCEDRRNPIYLIEDSANSPASTYKGKACGTWGDFGIWSFDAYKIMSTGDGGMLYSKTASAIQTAKKMLYLGLDEMSGYTSTRERWWEFAVDYHGRRGLMNDLMAAIGLEQLTKLAGFVEKRKSLSDAYFLRLDGIEQIKHDSGLYLDDPFKPSFYFKYIQLESQPTRDGLARYLRNKDIYVSMRYFPLHRVEYYQHGTYPLPGADYAADHTLLLPLHQSLTFQDVETVCSHIKEYFDGE